MRISRRALLAKTGALSTAALAGTGLAACGGTNSNENTETANATVELPTHAQALGPEPDLPAKPDGTQAGFHNYPADQVASVAEPPGSGNDTLTGMAQIYAAPPSGPDQNRFWAGLNERLGVDLDLEMVPFADYPSKFAVVIAGDNLPDLVQMQPVADFPKLLDRRFTPLDDYLGGDAVADYPNLAALPTFTWKSAIYNGHLYGIPVPRPRVLSYDFARADILAQHDIPLDIPDGVDGLLAASKEVTDPRQSRWAFGRVTGGIRDVLLKINDVPNGWRNDGNQLTHEYETDEFRQAIEDLTAFWEAGVVHPDAFLPTVPFKRFFSAGRIVFSPDGAPAWAGYIADSAGNEEFELGLNTFTKRDGSPARQKGGRGFYSFTGLTVQDPEKIKLALRVCDYLAAPFGTKEHRHEHYGEEGEHHQLDADGNPTLTETGKREIAVPALYLADGDQVLYQPGRPEDVDIQYEFQTAVMPDAKLNPTWGLFSNTESTKNAAVDKAFNDTVNNIVQGRAPLSALDDAVTTWREDAGDAMRDEYEQQL